MLHCGDGIVLMHAAGALIPCRPALVGIWNSRLADEQFIDVCLVRVGILAAECVKSSPHVASGLAPCPSALGSGVE